MPYVYQGPKSSGSPRDLLLFITFRKQIKKYIRPPLGRMLFPVQLLANIPENQETVLHHPYSPKMYDLKKKT